MVSAQGPENRGQEQQSAEHGDRLDAMTVLEQAQDIERFRALHWQGTMEEYFEKVRENPEVTRTANRRIYDMIMDSGSHQYEKGGKKLIHFNFFDDPQNKGREAVYGLDENVEQLMKMLKSGAFEYGTEKRILLLRGPVGSAKSTLARLLKRGLERYSETEKGAVYTFGWKNVGIIDEKEGLPSVTPDGEDKDGGAVLWSPMNEDPMALLPANDRVKMLEYFNEGREMGDYKVHIPEKGLSPFSRFYFSKLMEHYDGDIRKVFDHVVVKRLVISEEDRVGIGTYQPKDSKNQDTTELSGDINFRKIAQYGSDSDPRAFNFDGEFCVANRGVIEFVEMLKLDTEMLYTLLEASQSREIKPKKFSSIGIDELIIGHTNEPEYERLQNDRFMEAMRDRTVVVDIPYVTALSAEMKVYEKDYNEKKLGVHIAPHTIEVASQFAVLSRLEEPKKAALSIFDKMRLYDGKAVDGFTEDTVIELRNEAEREGFDGLSPRFIQDTFNECLVESDAEHGINAWMILKKLKERLPKSTQIASKEHLETMMDRLAMVEDEYTNAVKLEVQKALSQDENAIRTLAENYVQNVKAFLQKTKVEDPVTHEKVEPSEKFMRSIEKKMGISEGEATDTRRTIMETIGSATIGNQEYDLLSNRKLKRALEEMLFESNKDQISLRKFATAIIDPETQRLHDVIRDRLMENHGYNQQSAEDIIRYVSSVMNRGSSTREED